jgi:hypothetical protein
MSDMDRREKRGAVVAAFAKQIDWCHRLGSPFTAAVLEALVAAIEAGGTAAELLAAWPGDPVADALPLRMTGALHALVLSRADPDLAAVYPPKGPAASDDLRRTVAAVLDRHRPFIEGFLASPPQTNEVGRSGVLLGGFLTIADETGLPLRLLEIGASAGLNTIWDRYRYRLGEAPWGDPRSPLLLAPEWRGPLPPLQAPLRVESRHACDVAPIDLDDPVQRLRLRAYVWPDQRERLARLEGAIALARAAGQTVERADAATWVGDRLAAPAAGVATVLYHSIMWQYLPAATQAAVMASLEGAGRRAAPDAPLAWLRFELVMPEKPPELHLTLWPGGRSRTLAVAQPHGASVDWSGG